MNKRWWEQPTCWLCDYWWAFLLLIGLIAAAIIFKPQWAPLLGIPGTGDVQMTLRWQDINDLDLHVIDPEGNHLFFGEKRSPSGGWLDIDRNAGCGSPTNTPLENVYWGFGRAPNGKYTVVVDFYARCTGAEGESVPYTIKVKVGGEIKEFSGVLQYTGQQQIIGDFDY